MNKEDYPNQEILDEQFPIIDKKDLFPAMETTHCQGVITIEDIPDEKALQGDLGIQISPTGKVWICINGHAFLRFNPIALDYIKRGNG